MSFPKKNSEFLLITDANSRIALAACLLTISGLWFGGVSAQEARDDIDIFCPCRIESSGVQATATLSVRSLRQSASNELALRVVHYSDRRNSYSYYRDTNVRLSGVVAGNATLPTASYTFQWDFPSLVGPTTLGIQLVEREGDDWAVLDTVRMETVKNVSGSFDIKNLDYLVDTDGDGVGDLNERSAGTDPDDPMSRPGPSTIDVLALYSRGFAELYDGDPNTRIHHVMTVANGIYRDSDTGVRIRVVGIAEIEVETDETDAAALLDELRGSQLVSQERELHGSDLVMMFSPLRPSDTNTGTWTCGRANLGGLRSHGHLSGTGVYAVVYGNCRGSTAAHEIGHNLGLGHSFRQNRQGTFRWSRGHYVDERYVDPHQSRGTVMTYGREFDDRFSDPEKNCGGLPCGKDRHALEGADAVASINAVRFQVAGFRESRFDTDGDGLGDHVDLDDDGDGVADVDDVFPLDPDEWADSDGDGVGDNSDVFPLNPDETADSDGDGAGDNADVFPHDPAEMADSDGDGVGDNADVFPLNRTQTNDSDGDGVGDDKDAFPMDPDEWADTDGDGVGDYIDALPLNPSETVDSDGDGLGDHSDPDSDGDGVENEDDKFPSDRTEWSDADDDGLGDNADPDDDNDGVADEHDDLPLDPFETVDSDGDGVGDNWDLLPQDPSGVDVTASYRFKGARSEIIQSAGDIDGDGLSDILVGAPRDRSDGFSDVGTVYLVATADLVTLDAADGGMDQEIDLGYVPSGSNSWKLVGEAERDEASRSVAAVADLDGDGLAEVLVGAPGHDGGDERSYAGAVYLVSGGDLASADAADGTADGVVELGRAASRPNSWKLVGEAEGDEAGTSVASVPDLDGDGLAEVLVGAPGHDGGDERSNAGAVYLVSSGDLVGADAADGTADGVVELGRAASRPNSWKLVGETRQDRLGTGIASAGDIDGDGLVELILGVPHQQYSSGAVYLVSSGDLASADAADGEADAVVELGRTLSQPNSWKLVGEDRYQGTGTSVASAGDVNGDGLAELLVGAPGSGAVYLVSSGDLASADAADGTANSVVDLGNAVSHPNSWKLLGEAASYRAGISVASGGDVDGDGVVDLLVGAPRHDAGSTQERGAVYLVSGGDLAALDAADGSADQEIQLRHVTSSVNSWKLLGEARGDASGSSVAFAGDSDGDGLTSLLLGVDAGAEVVHIVLAKDLAILDNADGSTADRTVVLHNVGGDTDGDSVRNMVDWDDDGDGLADWDDPEPLENWYGTKERDDDDGDGVPDVRDLFPRDSSEWGDADNDGVGDNADAFPQDSSETLDADGDGVGDNADVFPKDPAETVDTDGDGVGNNSDPDDDGDGVGDDDDVFPLDPVDSADSDGDGVGDNTDAFPQDPSESGDSDGDGLGNNADPDADDDGVLDDWDLRPLDPSGADITASYRFIPENSYDGVGSVLSAGDIDGDGRDDILIGAPSSDGRGFRDTGAVYLIAAADLPSVDAADGGADQEIYLSQVPSGPNSWKLMGEAEDDLAGSSIAFAGDLDGDGLAELLLGAPRYDAADSLFTGDGINVGAVYLVSGGDLAEADAADGTADGVVELSHVTSGPNSWKLVGETANDGAGTCVASVGDLDGDGLAELLVGAPNHDGGESRPDAGAVYLVSGGDLAEADAADGDTDGVVDLGRAVSRPNSWKLVGEAAYDRAGTSVTSAGDVNGDGLAELLVGAPEHFSVAASGAANTSAAYLVSGGDLAEADAADGDADGVVDLGRVVSRPNFWKLIGGGGSVATAGDLDGDGLAELIADSSHLTRILSGADLDLADRADGSADGKIDLAQVPQNVGSMRGLRVAAARDVDGDGLGDLVLADKDAFHSNTFYLVYGADLAGLRDYESTLARAYSPSEVWIFKGILRYTGHSRYFGIGSAGDVDGDGLADLLLGQGRSRQPGSAGVVHLVLATDLAVLDEADGAVDRTVGLHNVAGDTDGDGTRNIVDQDDDGDGVADNDDSFPLVDNSDGSKSNHYDADDDGVPDVHDIFPHDSSEWADADNDGTGDNADPDDDNDGVADDEDDLPFDPSETVDSDGDGVGDHADTDDDGDGVADGEDVYPLDPLESVDSDADGVGDNWDLLPKDPSAVDITSSYRFIPEHSYSNRIAQSAGDIDGDARSDVIIGSSGHHSLNFNISGAVYLISAADLPALDAADGSADQEVHLRHVPSGPNSWKLVGEREHDLAGSSIASAVDLDGDGLAEVLVGAPDYDVGGSAGVGAAYLVSSGDLAAADAADGESDRVVDLGEAASRPNSWKLVGEEGNGFAGASVAFAGDIDGDGLTELLVGAPGHDAGELSDVGAAYLVSAGDLVGADAADGAVDGVVDLGRAASRPNSWKLLGETAHYRAGTSVASVGDLDGDGLAELLVGVIARRESAGYLVAGGSLAAADAADGESDGVIDLGHTSALPGNRKFIKPRMVSNIWGVSSAGDLNGDNLAELIVDSPEVSSIVSGASLDSADRADGSADGEIDLERIPSNSWAAHSLRVSAAGDVDGDGLRDLVLAETKDFGSGTFFLVHGSTLAGLPESFDGDDLYTQAEVWKFRVVDGYNGHSIAISSAGDVDGDRLSDLLLSETDTGVVRIVLAGDLAALDQADGTADRTVRLHNLAGDSDGDGVRNIVDLDDDGDGVPDGDDSSPLQNPYGTTSRDDDDGDAVADVRDEFSRDPSEWSDADNDGTGDNADPDDDNDGVLDEDDDLPFNALETVDSDGDGVGDNADAFPENSAETVDSDGDGVGDNADAFPEDSAETADTDGDGVGDNSDPDDDGDGVADGDDAFPLDPLDWVDSDGDGVGDNWDLLPRDSSGTDITASYRFIGEQRYDGVGDVLSAGDFDGDGLSDILIAAPAHDALGLTNIGAVYLVAAADLPALDAADGSADQAVQLGHVASGPNSWKLLGEGGLSYAGRSLASADLDNDGRNDLVVGAVGGHANRGAVYLVASADLPAADAADGALDGVAGLGSFAALRDSWKLVGEHLYGTAGKGVATVGDLDGDARPELVIGAPGHGTEDGSRTRNYTGAAYIFASGEMAAADAADGDADGVIHIPVDTRLATRQVPTAMGGAHSWTIIGEASDDRAGSSIAAVDDLDGDGFAELLVGAPRADYARVGAVYLLSNGDLAAADAVDGDADNVIDLGRAAALPDGWKFIGPGWTRFGIHVSSAGDLNRDSVDELIVETQSANGAYGTWIVSGAGLKSLDGAAGTAAADGVIGLLNTPSPPNSWKTRHLKVSAAGDVDGEGFGDLALVGTVSNLPHGRTTSYLLDGANLGGLPGVIESGDLDDRAGVWKFRSLSGGGDAVVFPAGDVDGDGLADLLLGESRPGVVHVLLSADLATLDEADGTADRTVGLHNLAGDDDGDGVRNIVDRDDDGDGVSDSCDLAPLNPRATSVDASNASCFHGATESAVREINLVSDRDNETPRIPPRLILRSYKLNPEAMGAGPTLIDASTVGDVHGDGLDDVVVGVANETQGAMYVISGRDLPGADGADGQLDGSIDLARVAAQPGSWRITGNDGELSSLYSVGPAGDMDGDGLDDMIIGAVSVRGAVYLVSGANLPLADKLDGSEDGQIGMNRLLSLPDSRELACNGGIGARCSVSSAGDFDGDGRADIVIGTPDETAELSGNGAVYLIANSNLPMADAYNGNIDERIDLTGMFALPDAWKLVGEAVGDEAGASVSYSGDIDGNGRADVLIGAPGADVAGAAYLVSGADLASADAVDGAVDGVIDLGRIALQPDSWKFTGEVGGARAGHVVSSAGDVNGDGVADIALGATAMIAGAGSAYLLSGAGLYVADISDGLWDGNVDLGLIASVADSWTIVGEADARGRSGLSPRGAGDVDGDGLGDLILSPVERWHGSNAVYLLSGADLPLLDRADGAHDGIISLREAQRWNREPAP